MELKHLLSIASDLIFTFYDACQSGPIFGCTVSRKEKGEWVAFKMLARHNNPLAEIAWITSSPWRIVTVREGSSRGMNLVGAGNIYVGTTDVIKLPGVK